LTGTGTDRLTISKEHLFETLEECVERAMYLAEEGDVIVFSPAFASFSKYFHNEYERNDAFVAAIKKYS
jgi:UDP-N-acetylmuramoylalanine-D-glutamate ligase